jgi:hypothetical protein
MHLVGDVARDADQYDIAEGQLVAATAGGYRTAGCRRFDDEIRFRVDRRRCALGVFAGVLVRVGVGMFIRRLMIGRLGAPRRRLRCGRGLTSWRWLLGRLCWHFLRCHGRRRLSGRRRARRVHYLRLACSQATGDPDQNQPNRRETLCSMHPALLVKRIWKCNDTHGAAGINPEQVLHWPEWIDDGTIATHEQLLRCEP